VFERTFREQHREGLENSSKQAKSATQRTYNGEKLVQFTVYVKWRALLVAQLVEALCHDPKGRGFNSR
jgi:hypothetical protein